MRRLMCRGVVVVLVLAICGLLLAQATQPSSATQALLTQVGGAYANLKALQLSGTYSIDADVAGRQEKISLPFTATFQAPNRFRHELKDDVLLVGTGEKLFAYLPARNQYMTAEEPAEKTVDLPADIGDLLREQNPSLSLAISPDASAELSAGADSVETLPDIEVDGKKFQVLRIARNDRDITALFDAQSHLLRRVTLDMRKLFEQKKVPQVKSAILVVDYTTTNTEANLDAAQFAFTPPAGATQIVQPTTGGNSANALVKKPAPTFTLENLEGKQISPLADNKGKVVVLDFWATWCGPCVVSLPHLQELAHNRAKEGVVIYAINVREDKDKVEQFITEKRLSLNVLLDLNDAVAARYLVDALPQTVVVGKDGMVRKVFVGFKPESNDLEQAIDAALREK